ncbi:MAG: hypothetical protein Q8N99_04275 [Nanoarchaeota archaeon]|nr:hypothetical protein [Nanoarchaeota archaeon]
MTYALKRIGRKTIEQKISELEEKILTGAFKVPDKPRVRKILGTIDGLLEEGRTLKPENHKAAFETLEFLSGLLYQAINLTDGEIPITSCLGLFEYLQLKTFRNLEKNVLERTGEIPEDFVLLKQTLSAYHKLRFALDYHNQGLIRFLMHRYGIKSDAFMQESQEALEYATVSFGSSRGCKFSPYASWRIIRAFERTEAKRPLSLNAIISRKKKIEAIKIFKEDREKSHAGIKAVDARDLIQAMMRFLSPRERKIVYLKYGFDGKGERSYEEVGGELRISGARAQNLGAKAIERLSRTPAARDFNYIKPNNNKSRKKSNINIIGKRLPRVRKSREENTADFKNWLARGVCLGRELAEASGFSQHAIEKYKKAAKEELQQDKERDELSYGRTIGYIDRNRDTKHSFASLFNMFHWINSARNGEEPSLEELLGKSGISFWDASQVLREAGEQPFWLYLGGVQSGNEWIRERSERYLELQKQSKYEYHPSKIAKLLERVADVKNRTSALSGKELVKGLPFGYATARRILRNLGVNPPYSVQKSKIGLELDRAVERVFYIPMPITNLANFLGVSYQNIFHRFNRLEKECRARPAFDLHIVDFSRGGDNFKSVHEDQLDYESASQIYRFQDRGIPLREIASNNGMCTFSDKSRKIVAYAVTHRDEIEPRINDALGFMFLDRKIKTPYLTAGYKKIA